MQHNPFKQTRRHERVASRLYDVLTEEELKKLLMEVTEAHHRLAFALGFYQAMRISEIVNLRPEHIDWKGKLIMIKQSKGAKDRNIPIAPQVHKVLRNFTIVKCGVRALQIAFKKYCKDILGKDMHFHLLRHSGLTYYATERKWDTLMLMRFAGHSNATTTAIYYHVRPQQLVDKMWELQ